MAANRTIKRASRLSDDALSMFTTAHKNLSSADALFAQEEQERRQQAAQVRADAEALAQQHEEHAEDARTARERNKKSLDKLAEFLN